MLIVGEKLSYFDYQVLLLCLAGAICMGLMAIEIVLHRFQVLPLLFPGMFTVRERRLFFFTFDISDGQKGKKVRADAKMLIRMTLFIVLSYLWHHCVLSTSQQVGTEFPEAQCAEESICFMSELHVLTMFTRQHEVIDCEGARETFPDRVVVSCLKFIPPSATTWLMHLAISHSITQLNFKLFEIFVWISGNSLYFRRGIGFLSFITFAASVSLFFYEPLFGELVSSWLSFVMSFSIPVFLYTTWKSSNTLEELWMEESQRVQRHIEERLNSAFVDIEAEAARLVVDETPRDTGAAPNRPTYRAKFATYASRGAFSRNFKQFLSKKMGTRGRSLRSSDSSADGSVDERLESPAIPKAVDSKAESGQEESSTLMGRKDDEGNTIGDFQARLANAAD